MFALAAALASDRASWAVVTGASSGIGAAAARQAAARGFNVLLAARRREQLRAAASVETSSVSCSWPHTLQRLARVGHVCVSVRHRSRLGPVDLACMGAQLRRVSTRLVDPACYSIQATTAHPGRRWPTRSVPPAPTCSSRSCRVTWGGRPEWPRSVPPPSDAMSPWRCPGGAQHLVPSPKPKPKPNRCAKPHLSPNPHP